MRRRAPSANFFDERLPVGLLRIIQKNLEKTSPTELFGARTSIAQFVSDG